MARQVLAEASGNVACPGGFWCGGCTLEALEELQWGKEGVPVTAWVPQLDPECRRLISLTEPCRCLPSWIGSTSGTSLWAAALESS